MESCLRRAHARLVGISFAITLGVGCSHHDAGGFDAAHAAHLGPVSGSIAASDAQTIVPVKARAATPDPRRPTDPTNLKALLAEGYGAFTIGPGEPPMDRTLDGKPAPSPGAARTRVARFVHISDFQLADDEAPTRLASFDGPPPIEGAFRPQEGYGCRILSAIVRTINRIDADAPIDMVLLGGDNVDNAQNNELDWIFGILDGSDSVHCDSGDPNDLVPGPNNDPKDPFVSDGLAMPWYWVTGNHDVLNQGNVVVSAQKIADSMGDTSTGGTRDYTQPGGPIVQGTVAADARRKMMQRPEMIARVSEDLGRSGVRGHGLGAYAQQSTRAFYTFDLASSPVRFVVMDTSAETGGADGVLHKADVDAFVKPELDRAKSDQRWVILASHHATDRLFDGNAFGGTLQADAMTQEEWAALLGTYENVILDLVGHAHIHRVQPFGKAPGHMFWEVQTGAVADFQNQFRLIEIWDEDNGSISIRATGVDYVTEGDDVAAQGRALGVLDWTSGWACCGPGQTKDRNVILWEKKP